MSAGPSRAVRGASCAAGPVDRVIRGVLAVIVGAFALSNLAAQSWTAIPTGICAILLTVSAVTGWCPTDLLRGRAAPEQEPNTLGFPEARQHVEIR